MSDQKGIMLDAFKRLDSAYIRIKNPNPLNIRPRLNLRGIEGSILYLSSNDQITAMMGASKIMASGFTDWNHPTGNSQLLNICRSTIFLQES